jgi:hypothetical protein
VSKASTYPRNDSKLRDGGSRNGPRLVGARATGLQQSDPDPSCQDDGMERVIERLRGQKYSWDDGEAAGEQWAKQTARYQQLKKLHENDGTGLDDPSLYSDVFLRAIDVDPEEGPNFWQAAGYSGQGQPPWRFLHGFCRAAQRVFEEVVDKL